VKRHAESEDGDDLTAACRDMISKLARQARQRRQRIGELAQDKEATEP
jgi:hypothetical protein